MKTFAINKKEKKTHMETRKTLNQLTKKHEKTTRCCDKIRHSDTNTYQPMDIKKKLK